jgi:polyphosphate kinase
MYRNLSKRIEVVTPVWAEWAKERLWKTLSIYLQDRRQAWTLEASGAYTQLMPDERDDLGSHGLLMREGTENAGDRARFERGA